MMIYWSISAILIWGESGDYFFYFSYRELDFIEA